MNRCYKKYLKSGPLVTAIIPTFNRENFLPFALESVKEQTYTNWELIIVDDGSSDNTKKICEDFSKTVGQPVKYIYQSNQGVASARNTGLNAAKGDFIAFLDSDDRWLPWHFKKSLKAFEIEPNLDVVFAAGRKINFNDGKILIKHNFLSYDTSHPILSKNYYRKKEKLYVLNIDTKIKQLILEYGLPSGLQCMFFKANSIKGLNFDEQLKIAEDRYFIYRLILLNKRFGFFLSINTLRFVHKDHLSGEVIKSPVKLEFIARNLIRAYSRLLDYASTEEKKVIKKKLAEFYLYYLNSALLEQGKKRDALVAIFHALYCNPFRFSCYKALIKALLNS